MANIGLNIETIRKSLKMTQDELSEKAGYKNSAIIVAIENGNNEPAYEKVKDIANALGVSIYQVKGQANTRTLPDDKRTIFYSNAEVTALDLFAPLIAEMDEDEKRKLLDYAILLLHASGKEARWKKPKFQSEKASKSDF